MATLTSPLSITEVDPYTTYAEAFARAKFHLEVIDGVPQEKPTPRQFHSLIQSYLQDILGPLFPKGHVLPTLDILVGGSDFLVPDLIVTGPQAQYRFGMLASPAWLAVEILSPGQKPGQIFEKCERLHAAGTELCWVIWPRKRQAWTYRPDSLVEEHERFLLPLYDGGEFTIRLQEMFSALDPWTDQGQ